MTASSSFGATVPMARSWSTAARGMTPFADQLLRALGQFEDLDSRGHAGLGPAERLCGAVLGQAASEHRVHGLGLLVCVQLLPGD